jgi:hypothetical protein
VESSKMHESTLQTIDPRQSGRSNEVKSSLKCHR